MPCACLHSFLAEEGDTTEEWASQDQMDEKSLAKRIN
ncbi:hypothetical protein CGRA01v4_13911 [Colletotrichum graminicola]|nr:hypothetical protein CGRA01v4_13911 [Colletotrichum graminicola]